MNVYKSLETDFCKIQFYKAKRRNGELRGRGNCDWFVLYQRRICFQYKKKKITTETKIIVNFP